MMKTIPHSEFRSLYYFKLVGDNVDKNVKPRNMHSDRQTQSLHFFNVYAVADRIDLSHKSNNVALVDYDEVDLSKLLPTADDEKAIHMNFCTLISRLLVKYMTHLQPFASSVKDHIQHAYSMEMSQLSTVVSTA